MAKKEKKYTCTKDKIIRKHVVVISVDTEYFNKMVQVDKKLKLVSIEHEWDKVDLTFEEIEIEDKLDPDGMDEDCDAF